MTVTYIGLVMLLLVLLTLAISLATTRGWVKEDRFAMCLFLMYRTFTRSLGVGVFAALAFTEGLALPIGLGVSFCILNFIPTQLVRNATHSIANKCL